MMNIGVASYSAAAIFFLILFLLLLTSWRGRLQGALLVSSAFLTAVWAAVAADHAASGYPATLLLPALEIFRNVLWGAFLLKLLGSAENTAWYMSRFRLLWATLAAVGAVLLSLLVFSTPVPDAALPFASVINASIYGYILLAVIGLVLVEQTFRNTHPDQRWAIKFLCIGIGGMFAYDFFLYSDALLLRQMDVALWDARGVINALVVPLIAVSAARNPQWSLDVFVSRRIVFHSAALLGAGIYLLLMAAGGYYIRYYGGSWGAAAQAVFFFGAGIMLLLVMFSGQVRAYFKVLLNKHFFSYKYDYRDEWLRLIGTLSSGNLGMQLRERVIRALADIVDSPGGMLWLRQDGGDFEYSANYAMSEAAGQKISGDSELTRFLEQQQWVVDIDEFGKNPDKYTGLVLPAWLSDIRRGWIIVPLMQVDALLGFVVLAKPRSSRVIIWEDSDLLKTAGRQAASYLAQYEAAQALINARQFETFNRLSAFVVHDLKNLIGQLSLMVANAEKHKHNPEFIEDMVATTEHSVMKMNRLLEQLRAGRVWSNPPEKLDIAAVLHEVVGAKSTGQPVPTLKCEDNDLVVEADRDRLTAIFEHLVQNAQDATPPDGNIEVRLKWQPDHALIEIEDSGCGMEAAFIRERLFRPFDSTKGSKGMGIGAYESRIYVRELGGDIDVISQPGEGTLFRLQLPAIKRDVDARTPMLNAIGESVE